MTKTIFAAILLLVTQAHAALENGSDSTTVAPSITLPLNGIFTFNQETKLVPKQMVAEGRAEENRTGVDINFAAGEPVAVEYTGTGDVILTLLLDASESGQMPEQVVVAKKDLEASGGLTFAAPGGSRELYAQFSTVAPTQVASYGNYYGWRPRRLSEGLERHRTHRMHFMGAGGCVAYVLSRIGGWPGGPSGNGVSITSTLRTVMHYAPASCSSPRPGTVASWSGGWGGRGHTAIWNGSCWAYDTGCGDPGSRYHLRNCVARY